MIKKIKTNSHEEWLALRHKYIGGSDCAAIIGMNRFMSAYDLYAEKTDLVEPFAGNLATDVGTFLEPFVAQRWAEETGKQIRNDTMSFVNDQYPWAIANIDRKVVGENAGLECKTCSELRLKEFSDGEYPENYYPQCVHYLGVTGYQKWYLAVLVGNKHFYTFEIERNEDEIQALMRAEKEFWYNHVIPRIPPAVDGSESTSRTISKVFPNSDDSTVDLFGMEGVFELRSLLSQQVKDLKTQIDELDNQIKLQMGVASKATCDKWTVSWKTQKTAGLDREAIKRDYPGFDPTMYQGSSRVFRVTEKRQKT